MKTELKTNQAIALYTAIEALMSQFRRENGDSEESKAALELCWEIEKLPASDQQTKVVLMASNLHRILSGQKPIPLPGPVCPKCNWHHEPTDACVVSPNK